MSYFKNKFKEGFLNLYGARVILMIAGGFLGIFFPLFLLDLFNGNIQLTVAFFGVASLFYLFLVPFGAMFMNSFGFKRALRVSLLFGALFYVIYFFIDKTNYLYLVPLSILVLVLFRIFHWIPYIVDFAKFSSGGDRAKQLSAFDITSNILTGLLPIASGFLIARFGFDSIFALGIFLYFVAEIFLVNIPKTREKFDWTYRKSWSEFLSKKNRKPVLAFFADGVENLIGLVVWPIFMFQLLDGDYFKTGYMTATIIVVTIILQLIFGKHLDSGGNQTKKKFLQRGTFLYAFGWIVKIFVVTAYHIFLAGVYHNVVRIFARTSFDTMFYDMASDKGHYVDEFTVVHEIAVHSGRVFAVVSVIILTLFVPLEITFLLGAGASIMMNLLKEKH